MSYILNALQKADAARGSALAPPPVAGLVLAPAPRSRWLQRWGLRAALGLGLLGAGLAVVWMLGLRRPPLPNGGPEPAPDAALALKPALTSAPMPALALAVAPAPPTTWPAGDTARHAPVRPAAPATRKDTSNRSAAVMTDAKPAVAETLPPATATPAATAEPVGRPAVQISGSSYSENPDYRMLIINGRMYREGETVAPDLVLLAIEPKTAWLAYRGQRYPVRY